VAQTKTYESGGWRYNHFTPEEIKPPHFIKIIMYILIIQKLCTKNTRLESYVNVTNHEARILYCCNKYVHENVAVMQ
jgi:hypothetical protein